ncbi:PAS domain S-box protein [Geomonas subterranea]|uniref:histidine kinase n=1 Tax=Geomonas subterranea TaxID=2847989 RepID=A0ABX8LHB1_9BACT|nr:PAS domain-containing protein [Geomonas subterranea]QXE91430.1 PAS domain S-box protein [Geomonas subterranea]QXM10482.1 PAS domain S-box protein [Geomonas subterranea]
MGNFALNLRSKILVVFLAISLATMAGMVLIALLFVKPRLESKLEKRGESIVHAISSQCTDLILSRNYFQLDLFLRDYTESEKDVAYIYLTTKSGEVIAHSFGREFPVALKELGRQSGKDESRIRRFDTTEGEIIQISAPVARGQLGRLHVGMSVAPIRKDINEIIMSFISFAVLFFISSLLLILFLDRWIVSPIFQIRSASLKVKAGDIDTRVAVRSRDEIGSLAEDFNSMLDAIRESRASLVQETQLLVESENRFRKIIQQSPISMSIVSADGTIVYINDYAVQTMGYEPRDIPHMSDWWVQAYPDPVYREQVIRQWTHLVQKAAEGSGYIERREYQVTCKDGTLKTFLIFGLLIDNEVFVVFEDITSLKQVEKELRTSKEHLDATMNALPDLMFRIDAEGRFHEVRYSSTDGLYLPPEQFLGKRLVEVLPQEQAQIIMAALGEAVATGRHRGATYSLPLPGGERWYELSLAAMGKPDDPQTQFIVLARDITERRLAEQDRLRLEQQLLHAQKLESLGVLAGGIAHDFNNLLTAIVGNTDLALMRLNPESPVRDNLQRIEQAASRAADLAKQMLAYSGKGRFVIETIDLNRLIREMTHMLEVSISKKAVLKCDLADALPAVEADATQLHQIIMNLIINASEAIGGGSGIISITTGSMECDRSYLSSIWMHEQLPAGLYVWLEISDTGCGMDAETVAKIFDPFFTTKFTGRGLGMAAVLGIIRGHKGAISVSSEPGRGTAFKVFLPASSKLNQHLDQQPRDTEGWRGKGTVLLVDDEQSVLDIGGEMLKELGFEVVTAVDGNEALELFKENPDRFSFIILDLTMPRLDGEQTYRELIQQKPDVKVIMSSGYNEQEINQRLGGKGLAGFVQKPYSLSMLRESIMNMK